MIKTPVEWRPLSVENFLYFRANCFLGQLYDWCALLPIRISNTAKHSPPSKFFEALIDTGASRCIFHSQIGHALGFKVAEGKEESAVGISGNPTKIYLTRFQST